MPEDKIRHGSFYTQLENEGIFSGYAFYASLKGHKYPRLQKIYNKTSSQLNDYQKFNIDSGVRIQKFMSVAANLLHIANAELEKEKAVLSKYLKDADIKDVTVVDLLQQGAHSENLQKFIQAVNDYMGTGDRYIQTIERIKIGLEYYNNVREDSSKKGKNERMFITNITKAIRDFYPQLRTKITNDLNNKNPKFVKALQADCLNGFKNMNNIEDFLKEKARSAYNNWFDTILLTNFGATNYQGDKADKLKNDLTEDQIKALEDIKEDMFNDFMHVMKLDSFINTVKQIVREEKDNNNLDGINIEKTILTELRSKKKDSRFANIRAYSNDNTGEVFTAAIAKALSKANFKTISGENMTVIIEATGSKGGKDDLQIRIDIPIEEEKKRDLTNAKAIAHNELQKQKINKTESSKRLKIIEDADKITENMKNAKQGLIVHANLKNYLITPSFSGFSAGAFAGSGGFDFLEKMYDKIGRGASYIKALEPYIRNMGSGMIGESMSGIRQYLETIISSDVAYALFDDVSAIGTKIQPEGGNELHILTLNEINIPLSFYLMRLAEAFQKTAKDLEGDHIKQLVSTSLKPIGAIYDESDFSIIQTKKSQQKLNTDRKKGKVIQKKSTQWESFMDAWENQKKAIDSAEIVTIKFLKNFAEIIDEFVADSVNKG